MNLSLFSRLFAEFHFSCWKYKEAVRAILMAMHHLRISLEGKQEHSDSDRGRFIELYEDLDRYYKHFCAGRYV